MSSSVNYYKNFHSEKDQKPLKSLSSPSSAKYHTITLKDSELLKKNYGLSMLKLHLTPLEYLYFIQQQIAKSIQWRGLLGCQILWQKGERHFFNTNFLMNWGLNSCIIETLHLWLGATPFSALSQVNFPKQDSIFNETQLPL